MATDVKVYERALGFEREAFPAPDGQPRYALRFGDRKINLQDRAADTENKAQVPTLGSGDFCMIAAVPLNQVYLSICTPKRFPFKPAPLAEAVGRMRSVYFRDPDDNFVEVAEYVSETRA